MEPSAKPEKACPCVEPKTLEMILNGLERSRQLSCKTKSLEKLYDHIDTIEFMIGD